MTSTKRPIHERYPLIYDELKRVAGSRIKQEGRPSRRARERSE